MKLFLLGLVVLLSGCTNAKEAYRVLEMDGVTEIKITGHSWFACSRDDFYSTGFTGVRIGRRVEGTVCSGLIFKSSTVRY